MAEKKWYIIKGPDDERWGAYEVKESDLGYLKDGCQVKGPFKNLVQCLIAANEPDRDTEAA